MHYVISDVHGCFYTLEKLLEKIRNKDSNPNLIFVGDYVDRGLHSKEVVELLIQLQKEGAICLRGNHDDVLDFILNGESVGDIREVSPFKNDLSLAAMGQWWLQNGLLSTISSYIEIPDESTITIVLELFVNSVSLEHKLFFRQKLELFWQNETHFVCHGFCNLKYPIYSLTNLSSDVKLDTLWSRFPMNENGLTCVEPEWDKIGVFGHTPIRTPIKHGKIRLIDTGAFLKNLLTVYCIEEDSYIFQGTDSRDIL